MNVEQASIHISRLNQRADALITLAFHPRFNPVPLERTARHTGTGPFAIIRALQLEALRVDNVTGIVQASTVRALVYSPPVDRAVRSADAGPVASLGALQTARSYACRSRMCCEYSVRGDFVCIARGICIGLVDKPWFMFLIVGAGKDRMARSNVVR